MYNEPITSLDSQIVDMDFNYSNTLCPLWPGIQETDQKRTESEVSVIGRETRVNKCLEVAHKKGVGSTSNERGGTRGCLQANIFSFILPICLLKSFMDYV